MQEDGLNAQLMRGSLQLDVTRLINEGVLTWQDTLAPVLGTEHATPGGFEVSSCSAADKCHLGISIWVISKALALT